MEIVMTAADWIKTISIIVGALGVLGSFLGLFLRAGKVLKSIETLGIDQKEMKGSIKELKDCMDKNFKEVNTKLENQGNRLTAIETTLRLADWFVPHHDHEREKANH